MMHPITGIRIVVVNPTAVCAPARPHRKKRIAKKWLKKYGWKVVRLEGDLGDQIMYDERHGVAYCHAHIANALRVQMAAKKNEPIYLGTTSPGWNVVAD